MNGAVRNDFPVRRIADVCDVVNGGTPKTGEPTFWDGAHQWITPAEMGKRKSPYVGSTDRTLTDAGLRELAGKLVPAKSVILSSRAPIGHLVINSVPMAFNQGCKGLVPQKELNYKFLYYYLNCIREELDAMGTGATFRELSGGRLKEVTIPLPPLPQQQRIVGILDESFAALATAKANTEKNLCNARGLLKSFAHSVFFQKGVEWVQTTLGEIGKVSMCKRIFKDQTVEAEGVPFYKIGTFGREPDSFIPNHIYKAYREKYPFPKKGDVLVSAAGTIGRRVKYDGECAYFQDSNIVWIDNDETKLLNDYLYHFYSACEWNSTRGATISRLYNDDLRRIVITFPKSLHQQRRIVGQLDALTIYTERLTTSYQQKLTALEALKKSLLHQAFTGQLTSECSADEVQHVG